jgi:F0F1-type ATP synthase assembly protein I
MNGTRKSTNWGSYIGLAGLLVWGVILGFHAQAWYGLAGVALIVAIIGGIIWGAGMVRRHSRAAKVQKPEAAPGGLREDR